MVSMFCNEEEEAMINRAYENITRQIIADGIYEKRRYSYCRIQQRINYIRWRLKWF